MRQHPFPDWNPDPVPDPSPIPDPSPLAYQDGMTQAAFDRMTPVVSANECTGLAPAGLEDEDDDRLLGELGGPRRPE